MPGNANGGDQPTADFSDVQGGSSSTAPADQGQSYTVQSGDSLVTLVPASSPLEVEADVDGNQAGFVRVGTERASAETADGGWEDNALYDRLRA